MQANHPFAHRSLNPLDENGQPGCAVCGRPPSAHNSAIESAIESAGDGIKRLQADLALSQQRALAAERTVREQREVIEAARELVAELSYNRAYWTPAEEHLESALASLPPVADERME